MRYAERGWKTDGSQEEGEEEGEEKSEEEVVFIRRVPSHGASRGHGAPAYLPTGNLAKEGITKSFFTISISISEYTEGRG